MLSLLRRRNFLLLWSAALITGTGDWVLITALPFYVYATTHSTLASGATFLAGNLPGIAFGSVAGVFVDRWDRKRTLVIGELLQGALLLPLLLVHSGQRLWVVYVVLFAESTIAQFSIPAFQAAIPLVVGEDKQRLVEANSGLSSAENITRIVGPALAGLLITLVGLAGVILLDAASFAASSALVGLIVGSLRVSRPRDAVATAKVDRAFIRLWHEWVDGLRFVAGERWVALLIIVPAISVLGDGMFTALLAPFVNAVGGGSALVFGWVLTVRGIGGLTGGIVLSSMSKRVQPVRLIGPSALLLGSVQLLMVGLPSVPMTLATMAFGGIVAISIFVNISTLLQRGIPDRFLGRVFASYGTCLSIAVVLGNLTGSLVGDIVGIRVIVGCGAGLSIVAGLLAVMMLRGHTAEAARKGLLDTCSQ